MIYIFLLIVAFFAWYEAGDDHDDIRQDIPIGHTRAWIIRAVIVSAIAAFFILFFSKSWWTLIPMLTSAAAMFASVHRSLLNRFMGRHLCYVDPSNWTDRQWLRLVGADPSERPTCAPWISSHGSWYRELLLYRGVVHRAGRLAYITEAVAFATSLYFLW